MAQAIIVITDVEGEVDMEVKFSPNVDNESPAHQLVQEFVKFAKMEKVEEQPLIIKA
jgi:hypothetical protein